MSDLDGLVWTNEREFSVAVSRMVSLTDKTFEEEALNQVRLGVEKMIKITPPGSGIKGTASAAKKAGMATISKDMNRVMAPVDLKGTRTITHLFGRPAELVGGPWTVKTKEKTPDVAGYYAPFYKNGRRPKGRHKEAVGRLKFNREKKKRQRRSGWLAGGFGPSALVLGARMPGYAKRHMHEVPASRKPTIQRFGDDGITITIENNVKYASQLGLQKRLNWAMQIQVNSMERQIPYLQRKAARATGF